MKGPGISRFTYKRNYRGSGERQGERTCTGLQLQDVHAVTERARRCRTGVRHEIGAGMTVPKTGSAGNAGGTERKKPPRSFVRPRAVSDKRRVLTRRGRESEAKTESRPAIEPSGINKKGPPERLLRGSVNPAATYSPGPEGQVPSAI